MYVCSYVHIWHMPLLWSHVQTWCWSKPVTAGAHDISWCCSGLTARDLYHLMELELTVTAVDLIHLMQECDCGRRGLVSLHAIGAARMAGM